MTIQEMIARQQAIVTQARNEGRGLSREEQMEFDPVSYTHLSGPPWDGPSPW